MNVNYKLLDFVVVLWAPNLLAKGLKFQLIRVCDIRNAPIKKKKIHVPVIIKSAHVLPRKSLYYSQFYVSSIILFRRFCCVSNKSYFNISAAGKQSLSDFK